MRNELRKLIEQCGDHFQDLSKTKTGWMVNKFDVLYKGDTPEEAVNKLLNAIKENE